MNYTTALKAHEMIEKIKLNKADIEILTRVIENGIEGAQLVIMGKDGKYNSTLYREDRIDLLLQVLYEKNTRLMTKLKEL